MVIAHSDIKLMQLLSPICRNISCVFTGTAAYEALKSGDIDALILNAQLPGMDAIEILRRLSGMLPKQIFILTADYGDLLMTALSEFKIDGIFLLPANMDEIACRILENLHDADSQNYAANLKRQRICKTTDRLLESLGFSKQLCGYSCIQEAVALIVIKKQRTLATGIYEAVGKLVGTSAQNVERRIRHAIEQAWLLGSIKKQQELFGYTIKSTKGKPTNAELLFRLADIVGGV
ncbi:MAG: hypothetical protein IJA35_00370 [Clostridia bacterium]|nr:hypothetical protein [Clostridia bacterium]